MVSISASRMNEIRLVNICVDMSLPMHFNKFMVAIKQIVSIFFFVRSLSVVHRSVFDSCYIVGTCVAGCGACACALTRSLIFAQMNCGLCHMVIYSLQ